MLSSFFSPLTALLYCPQALNWLLSPMTLNSWIQLYLQIAASRERAAQQAISNSTANIYQAGADPPSDLDSSAHSFHERHTSTGSPCDLDTSANSSHDLNTSTNSACGLDSSGSSGVSDLVVYASSMDLAGPGHVTDDEGGDVAYKPSAEDGGSDTDSGDEMDVREEQQTTVEQNIVHPFYSPHVYLQVSQVPYNSHPFYSPHVYLQVSQVPYNSHPFYSPHVLLS